MARYVYVNMDLHMKEDVFLNVDVIVDLWMLI